MQLKQFISSLLHVLHYHCSHTTTATDPSFKVQQDKTRAHASTPHHPNTPGTRMQRVAQPPCSPSTHPGSLQRLPRWGCSLGRLQQEPGCERRAEIILWNADPTEIPTSQRACNKPPSGQTNSCLLHRHPLPNDSESRSEVLVKVTSVCVAFTSAASFFILTLALPHESEHIK